MKSNLNIGDKIVTSIHRSGIYEEELEIIMVEQYDAGTNTPFFKVMDENGFSYDIPYEYYGTAPYERVDKPRHINVSKIKSSDKIRVLSNQYPNLQQPLYVVINAEEQGVKVIDDNNEEQYLSYNGIEKLDNDKDTFLDMAVSLSTQFTQMKRKVNNHEMKFEGFEDALKRVH